MACGGGRKYLVFFLKYYPNWGIVKTRNITEYAGISRNMAEYAGISRHLPGICRN
jgi:hypothetical protein